METKKTKLTISGKPKKNFYDNQGLTNNKKKQKFVTEKKFSKPFNKSSSGSSKFPKKTFSLALILPFDPICLIYLPFLPHFCTYIYKKKSMIDKKKGAEAPL